HHFYTASVTEARQVKSKYPEHIWKSEGDAFRVPAAVAPPAPVPAVSFGSGAQRVGETIPAGVYRTDNTEGGCHWVRSKVWNGPALASSTGAPGPIVVELLPTDVWFENVRCGTWRAIESYKPAIVSNFGVGTH